MTVTEHIATGTHPACAARQAFLEWFRAAVYAHDVPESFCEDCTRQYQHTMRHMGRCNEKELT